MGDDLVDDLFEMNEISTAIIGAPMGVALAPMNPAREQNGRLIQDARMTQMTDPTLRLILIEVARSSLDESSSVDEHAALLDETFTAAALLGTTTEVGRIVESMEDARFCRWLATAQFK